MKNFISTPIKKTDHRVKTEGSIQYIADIKWENMLFVKTLRSTRTRAYIEKIHIPTMPEGYFVIDYKDIPGKNILKVIVNDNPVLAEDKVNYIGEPILLVVGPKKDMVLKIVESIVVTYEDRMPILNIEDALDNTIEPIYETDNSFAKYQYEKGDCNDVFQKAYEIFEESFETGYQEHAYIEPQGMVAVYAEDKISVYGSIQCPYYVKNAVVHALGCSENKVRIVQSTTGGGFGGKEDYPSLLGCHVALAALKTKKTVQLIMDRKEDMEVTTKRHPAKLTYKTALDKEGNILGMDIDIKLNGGAYAGLSSVVMQRSLICATGVYNIPHLKVKGKALATNTVPTGAFRGFGAPQSFFAIEMHMGHIAKKLGLDPLEYKKRYMVKTGDSTSTSGFFRDTILLPEMLEEIENLSNYSEKYRTYKEGKCITNKGIGISLFLHGCGFTGSGERDHIRATVKLKKYSNGIVEILVSNVDIGQGLQTTLNKIVSTVLEVPIDKVIYANPDTDRVPDSGPTVASRSLMIVGKLLERAAEHLKEIWVDGKEQEITEHYKHTEFIPWDEKKFTGDAYPTYSWGVNVVEVEVDTITGQIHLSGIWSVFDVGIAIDERIIQGQIEGGMLQGLGYGSLEVMASKKGSIQQKTITDYIIPTAKDVVRMENRLIKNPYKEGPFGAKGAGELTLIGGAPALIAAIENAVNGQFYKTPVTPEDLMEVLEDV
ncbi:CO/xanthine dehydrogenase Mo-binding subunit [Natranaerovirga pectinivora]|uniref:CO/xanthine dehydrogenase Mo-binding subunit n=1 Tax=Natranaerovirga pectinivora TaxID=682400 RepID=A0A4R3MRC6_9FIRM|nr:xanthine dehydrogenase family protein molybdopterin-binding subunit [Natranaerovirga pectinivora]TCT16738.1 CO/xanthine dehydrogenase Mo-binding subunit [Natranaerovirga pectinivora]